jgi:WD40 repeat protein
MVRQVLLVLVVLFGFSLGARAQSTHRRWVGIGHNGPIMDIQVAPNGKYFVTAGAWDGRVIIWDGATNRYITHFQQPGAPEEIAYWKTCRIAISANSQYLAFTDSAVHVWDVAANSLIASYPLDSGAFVRQLRFSRSSDSLAWIAGLPTQLGKFCIAIPHLGTVQTKVLAGGVGMGWTLPQWWAISPDLKLATNGSSVFGFDSLYSNWSFSSSAGGLYTTIVRFTRAGDSIVTFETTPKSVLVKTSCATHEQVRDTISGLIADAISVDDATDSLIILSYVPSIQYYMVGLDGGYTKFKINNPHIPEQGDLIRMFPNRSDLVWGTPDPGVWGGVAPDLYHVYLQRSVRNDSSRMVQVNVIDRFPTQAHFSRTDDTVSVACLGFTRIGRSSGFGHSFELSRILGFAYDSIESKLAIKELNCGDVSCWANARIVDAAGCNRILNARSVGLSQYDASDIAFGRNDTNVIVGRYVYSHDTALGYTNGARYYRNAISTDRSFFLAANGQEVVRCDAEDGFPIDSFATPSIINSIRLNRRGTMALITDRSGSVNLWSIPDYMNLHQFKLDHGSLGGARFSPDEKSIVVSCGDSSIVILDAETGSERVVIKDFPAPYFDVEVSHDGKDILGLTPLAVVDYDSIPIELATVSSLSEPSALALTVNPNPLSNSARIQLSSQIPVNATVLLFDELGRQVAQVWSGNVDGTIEIPLMSSRLDLRPGVYSCVARTKAGTARAAIVIQ